MKRFDKYGREIPDSTEVEIPLRFRRSESQIQEMRRLIAEELSRVAEHQGFESLEESDDFDVGDDEGLPFSPHELTVMQEEAAFVRNSETGVDVKKDMEDDVVTVNGGGDNGGSNGGSEDGKDGERSDRGKSAGDGKEFGAQGKPDGFAGGRRGVSEKGK